MEQAHSSGFRGAAAGTPVAQKKMCPSGSFGEAAGVRLGRWTWWTQATAAMRSEACSLALIRQVEGTTTPTSKPVPGGTELSCLLSLNLSAPRLGVVQSVSGRPLCACVYRCVFSSFFLVAAVLVVVVVVEVVCCCTGRYEFDGERGCLLPPRQAV